MWTPLALEQALREDRLGPRDHAVLFHDLDQLQGRLERLGRVFPANTLHAVAIKANPVVGVLRELVAWGAGLEAASWEEVCLARAAGCPPDRIVFDSPAKTREELADALALGLRLNADNLDELARLDALGARGLIGLRVNPQVGAGRIAITSVAQKGSKFGTPLDDLDLAALFARYPWLNGLHVHVGSQGCPVEQLVTGVKTVWEAARPLGLAFFDVGGGLGVDYHHSGQAPSVEDYGSALLEACPGMRDVPLVTEFGRWLQAPCGWAASRVEYVKPGDGELMAILHLGADLFLRKAYHPAEWHHEMVALDPAGRVKTGAPGPWTVVGPLCFGGDVLGRGVPLVAVEPGDWVALRDVGAYTLGMWSRHCSRALPRVLGWKEGALSELKARETLEEVVRFWS